MTITSEALANDIIHYCRENASEAMVKKYSRYFKGEHNAWGLTQELMDAKKEELLKSGILNVDIVFDTAPLLMESGKYEEISFALAMLNMLSDQFDRITFHRLEDWFVLGIHNWAHADFLGMMLLPKFLKQHVVLPVDFIPWITSPHKFQRRCVPVTFIKSLKQVPLDELLSITEPLMMDTEREVHQGMGWFLREAWKLFPYQTEEFLLKWKETAPRLIIQYACEKMGPEDKLRFRRSKKIKS